MRILNIDSGQPLQNICIYLTPSELSEMVGTLEDFQSGEIEHHAHINDQTHRHEITLAVYTAQNLKDFDERSQRLILEDK